MRFQFIKLYLYKFKSRVFTEANKTQIKGIKYITVHTQKNI